MAAEKEAEVDGQTDQKKEGESAGFKSYLRIFSYADRTSWALYSVSFIAAIAAGAALPFMDLIFGKFVTVFNNYAIGLVTSSGYMSEVERFTLYLVYLFIAKFALVYIHSYCVSIAAIRTTKALRIHFLQSLLRQDIPYFDGNPGSASIKVTTNGNLVNNGISEKLSITIQCMSTFVVAFIIALVVQWKLTLITICIIPSILVVTSICIQIDVKIEANLLAIYSRAGLLAEEVFSSITTVHSFWLHPVMAERYDGLLAEAEKVGNKKSPNYGVLFSTEYFCIFCGYALAFYKGIRMYASGEIEQPGSIVTVIFAVVVASTSLTQIAPQILHVTKAASAADELFRTIDRASAIDPMSTAGVAPETCTGDIELKDLTFAYPSRPDTQVLNGISLNIPARKTTALVGASGSGKSTIVALLERWYDQSSGTVTIDGVDIRQLNVQWLRTRVRLVQQEPVLFSGTVFENVANGLIGTAYANASDEERIRLVEKACRDAYAHDFISQLPLGYQTPVGERARMLSGGQKQRIAIARSIISNPPILLLDEATSALDPKAEKIVQDALDNVSANRTTITIAHKLSTIQKADNIAVMSAGSIIEQGTHGELIAKDGAYARLVRAQDLEKKGGSQSSTPPGGAEEEPASEEDEKAAGGARLALNRTQSIAASTFSLPASEKDKKTIEGSETLGLSLLRCLFILVREQPELWWLYSILSCVCVVGGLTFPAQAILFARTFSVFQLRGPEAARQGDFWALMFFVVALANLFAYFILGWICNTIIQRVTRRYRLELFATTMKQEIAFFDSESNATGAITSRLSSCATNLQELLGVNSGLIVINLTNILSSSILGIVYGWKLGLVCVFGALPPLVSSGYLRIRLETKLEERTEARFASSAALAAEAVAAIRTVASLAMESRVLEIYSERLADVAGRSARTLVGTMFWYALTQSVNFLAMALGFWYGGKLVSSGEYTNEQFFVVFIAVIFGGEAAAAFFQYTTSLTKAGSAANYILWLRERVPLIPADDSSSDSPPPLEDKKSAPSLACNDLAFAYPSRPKASVIKGINITIKPGSFIALVGPSGCGKSTMIALLSRFYDPVSGTITVDSSPITSLPPRLHRMRLALVQQEPVLYQGSVRENVAMGVIESRRPSDEEVEAACRSANILDFVESLPEGLDTSLGNRGLKLSGGQRQRIAIARALIRDPKILLLDEATSALDTESEKVVQAALMDAAREGGRSTVAVAHRLSTVKEAECIFVFSRGRVVEAGGHEELVEKRGVYWEMCLGQALDKGV